MHIAATYPEEASTVSWDFGESGALTGPHIQHIYTQAGDYQAELTVVDPDGDQAESADYPNGNADRFKRSESHGAGRRWHNEQ